LHFTQGERICIFSALRIIRKWIEGQKIVKIDFNKSIFSQNNN